jgi:VanZ family protein
MIQFAKLFFKRKYYIYLPLIIYWIILFIATTIPGKSLPPIGVSDKINHLVAYFILTVMLDLTFLAQQSIDILRRYSVQFAILTAAVYGIIDEIHQSFIPGRSCDFYDWIADIIGASLTFFVYKYFFKPKLRDQKIIPENMEP